jgi:plasmid stability protein
MKPLSNHSQDIMAINITVKNIPPELHKDLKESAVRHRRSLNGEIIALLEERLRPRKRSPKEMLAVSRALRKGRSGVWLSQEMIDHAKKEGRL